MNYSRRDFINIGGHGLGAIALSSLCSPRLARAMSGRAHVPHFSARAKSVIWLVMNGGQSQVDTWDYKPQLALSHGQKLEGFNKEIGFSPEQVGTIMQSPFSFKQYGQSGKWASEILPQLAQHTDEMTFVHSCFSKSNNHSPALFTLNTGESRMGYPCVGSWATYGMGGENSNLPSFVVMTDPLGRGLPKGQAQNWGAGFLPGMCQGTALNNKGPAINNLVRTAGMTQPQQRRQFDLIRSLNREHEQARNRTADLEARIKSFELAYRMQTSAPEAFDLEREPESIKELYGINNKRCQHFARQCLNARRLVERGVRFVQLYSGGTENQKSWDGHIGIGDNHRSFAAETDQPIAALLTDLKQRGLLDETLVICGSEFGRLPVAQVGNNPGRDHNPNGFTTWFAGGGTKKGFSYGTTDELGHEAVDDKVSIHDLHATILHLLGIDHQELTYRFNGFEIKLTGVEEARVIKEIIA